MKNRIKNVILILLLGSLLISVVACRKKEIQLDTPANLQIIEKQASWQSVEHAKGYVIDIDGTQKELTTTSYNIEINQPGSYPVKVKAVGENQYKDSDWSNVVYYVVEEEQQPVEYKIEEEFNDPADLANWGLGPIENMIKIANGQMTFTHTGVTQYPSKGKTMRVTLSEFPYVVVKVTDVGGPNARWAIKIKLPQDETASRTLATESNLTGQFFFDLTKVPGLEDKDDIIFDLYIYIIETEGTYASFDYIRSVKNIPGTENFNSVSEMTVTNGKMTANDGVVVVEQTSQTEPAKLKFNLDFDFTLAPMIDLFVAALEEGSSFSLEIDGKKVLDNKTRYGHFGIAASDFNLTGQGKREVLFTVNGKVTLDYLSSALYQEINLKYDGYNEDTIYDAVTLKGSADVGVANGNLVVKKLASLTGNAIVEVDASTNLSTFPKFIIEVERLDEGATLIVSAAQHNILTITEAGKYTFDLTSIYQSGLSLLKVALQLNASGDASAEIKSISLERDELLSQNALAPKGTPIEHEGALIEEGNHSDNWFGNAKIISRNGQLMIINTDSYSKGEVFAKNVDLLVNRFLNIKIDELTDGARWKVDFVLDVDLPTQRVITVQEGTSKTGVLSYDLYQIFGLNETTKIIERLSVSVFVEWGAGKIVKIDYIRIESEPAEENQIINITPEQNIDIALNQEITLSAKLKYEIGNIVIKIKNELGEDVTSSVFVDGKFKSNVEGAYTVEYTYGDLKETRIIHVTSQPVISTNNTNTTIAYDQTLIISATVNPDKGGQLTYKVFFEETDVTNAVLSEHVGGKLFTPSQVGVYSVVLSYPDASDVTFKITVNTGWVGEDVTSGTLTSNYEDGILSFSYVGGFHWPLHNLRKHIIIDETPYLLMNVKSITGGTWKGEFGDPYSLEVVKEGTTTGLVLINLKEIAASAGYAETHKELEVTFIIYIVGTNVKMEISEFRLLTLEEITEDYNQIINVKPAVNLTAAVNDVVDVSAELKYENALKPITIKVLNAEQEDVTSSVLVDGKFQTDVAGVYTISYSADKVTTVSRVITVVSLETPIISSTNPNENEIVYNQAFELNISISNQTPGKELTVSVKKDGAEEELNNLVDLENLTFKTENTGKYVLTFSYPGADDFVLEVNVVTGWIPEIVSGGTIASNYEDGVLQFSYEGGYYWPIFKFKTKVTIDETPYLLLNVDSIVGGTWKLDFGDPYPQTVVADGTSTGLIAINLKDYAAGSGYSETHKELEVTFVVYIVGANVKLNVSEFRLLTIEEVSQNHNQIVNVKPTNNINIAANEIIDVSAKLKYANAEKPITIKVLNAEEEDVTSIVLVDGKFQTDIAGVYTVSYSADEVETVTRIITVLIVETPIISSTNPSENEIYYDETFELNLSISNQTVGSELTVSVKKDGAEEELNNLVDLENQTFKTENTGKYVLTFSYPGAVDFVLEVNVKTRWIPENTTKGTLSVHHQDGVLKFAYVGDSYWPSYKLNTKIITDETPYLLLNVDSIVGGTWKLNFGDQYAQTVVAEGTKTGLILINLKDYAASAGYSQTHLELDVVFAVFVVGTNVKLNISEFRLLDIDEIAEDYNQIVNVKPAANLNVAENEEVDVSAELKYENALKPITIKVLNAEQEDVTSTVLVDGKFKASAVGVYTVSYSAEKVTTVTRVITVLADETPIISSTNPSENEIVYNETFELNLSISNQTEGAELTVSVKKDGAEEELNSLVDLENLTFKAENTGNYILTFSYPGADDFVLEVKVVTGWIPEIVSGGTLSSNYEDGILSFSYQGGFHWPLHNLRKHIIIDETPYLLMNVKSITGGTWKSEFGDPYSKTVVAEGTTTGLVLINLKDIAASAGYGETHKELEVTFIIYIVGTNVKMEISEFRLLTIEEIAEDYNQIVNVKPTANLNVVENQEVDVSAELKYENALKPITIKVLNAEEEDVTATVLVGGKFKTDILGVYTVSYSAEKVTNVTRVITVLADDTPVISSTNPSENTIYYDETFELKLSVSNQTVGSELTVSVKKDGAEEELNSLVDLENGTFKAANTGNYVLTFSYPGAVDFVLEVNVKTRWVPENISSGTISSHYQDGVL